MGFWDAVASAGLYVNNLHSLRTHQHLITSWRPTDSVKAMKARSGPSLKNCRFTTIFPRLHFPTAVRFTDISRFSRTVVIAVMGCWCGYLSGVRCRLAHHPADATATHCLLDVCVCGDRPASVCGCWNNNK